MLSTDWLRAFLPVGILNGESEFTAIGAGVLLSKPPLVWFVTASHVVKMAATQPIAALVPSKEHRVQFLILTDLHTKLNLQWLHDNDSDLAVTPFPVFPDMDIMAVGEESCLGLDQIIPSMQTYTVGCPYGFRGIDPNRVNPLVMDGIVCGTNPQKSLIFTSAPTFPGNSGGPLLVVRSPISPHGQLTVGKTTVFLAGIINELTIIPSGQQEIPALHLGMAISVDKVWSLLESGVAENLANRAINQSNQ